MKFLVALLLSGCAAMPLRVEMVPPEDAIIVTHDDMQRMLVERARMLAEIMRLRASRTPLCDYSGFH